MSSEKTQYGPQSPPPYPMDKPMEKAMPPPIAPMGPPYPVAGPSGSGPTVVVEHRYMMPEDMEAQAGRRYHDQLLARCAKGQHEATTKFGPCGIITSVIMFPIGLLCLMVDQEKRCSRCGAKI